PVKAAAFCLLINAALNFLLMWPFKIAGIALASSIAALINFVLLLVAMNRRLGGIMNGLRSFAFRVVFSAFVCGLAIKWLWFVSFGNDVLRLIVVSLAGIGLYAGLCFYLEVDQARRAWKWIVEQKKQRF
ncbi:MAG: polysaccharide biosynthesis C-terminal domain-containing protein, partial [Candidatus Omnitrophota bacterium]